MTDTEAATALSGFGFTPIESQIYCELLRQSPATGYRLAQKIGKAAANTYQALKVLTHKGAVIPTDSPGDATSYVPVPPDQLLTALERVFEDRKRIALVALKEIHAPARDEVVYQLRSAGQVMERARAMLAQATETITFDLVPTLYDLLREDVAAARLRGVEVTGIAYRREDKTKGMPFAEVSGKTVEHRWPGLGMIVITDGCQSLVAQISRDLGGVLNAVYSDSVFLSCILHTTVVSDIRLNALLLDPGDLEGAMMLGRAIPPGRRHMTESAGTGEHEGMS